MKGRLTMLAGLVVAVALGLLVPGAGAATQGTNLDQCANGKLGSPTTCGSSWQHGDLNPQNSFYREGDSVPFRATLTNLTSGSHTLVIQYDTVVNGKHAYDYLTKFDETVSGTDPCDGVSPCSGPLQSGTIDLSDNPSVPNSSSNVPGSDRYFSIWNGSINGVALGGAADVSGEQQSVTVQFTNTDSTVVVAWAGHVADEITWPHATAAGSIPGSPYHMRIVSLDGKTVGNQDRSMKAVVVPPPGLATDVSAGSFAPGDSVTDTATLGETNGTAVTGTVAFFVCYSSSGTPDCTTGGTQVGSSVTVSSDSATSDVFTPQDDGTYCFRAEYTPASDAPYSPAHDTNTLIESDGNHGECFSVGTPPPPDVETTITLSNGQAAGDSQVVGTTVHDVASVAGDNGLPTGTVTFDLFAGTGCQGDPTSSEQVTLDGGSASSSDTQVPDGGLSYLVHYTPDNASSDSYSPADALCENLSSSQPPPPPTPEVATTITTLSGPAGDSQLVDTVVHDVAVVNPVGDNGTPTGSVTFSLFKGTGCQGGPSSTEQVDLANGSASSSSTTVPAGGLSYQVHYNGDDTYAGADAACENLSSSSQPPPPTTTTSPPAPTATPTIDLAITKDVAPTTVDTNSGETWTETVTNNGPDGATGVTVSDTLPVSLIPLSVATTQGSCTLSGQAVRCGLGDLAKGATATVTVKTLATRAGSVVNTATVSGNETDTNPANNTDSATLTVNQPFVPPTVKPKVKPKAKPKPKPVYCSAVTVVRKTLYVGRKSLLTVHVRQHGKLKAGVRVRLEGKPLHLVTKRSNKHGLVRVRVTPKRAGIIIFRAVGKSCNTAKLGVTGVFTPPVTG